MPFFVVRSLFFHFTVLCLTASFGSLAILIGSFLPYEKRSGLLGLWCRSVLWCARVICGIHIRFRGIENIPDAPSIIVSNHQSALETFALQKSFSPLSVVVKKELLTIPVFGRGLRLLEPIVLDRRKAHGALKSLVREAKKRLQSKRWILIFPEGTRSAPGRNFTFKAGAAQVALASGYPILPIAHNAGACWAGKSWILRPGIVTFSIGPLLVPKGANSRELTGTVESWIRSELATM